MTGAGEQYLQKTYFVQNLNVKQVLQLYAQRLPGCEQVHSISPDPGRWGHEGATSEGAPADVDTLACRWMKSYVSDVTRPCDRKFLRGSSQYVHRSQQSDSQIKVRGPPLW